MLKRQGKKERVKNVGKGIEKKILKTNKDHNSSSQNITVKKKEKDKPKNDAIVKNKEKRQSKNQSRLKEQKNVNFPTSHVKNLLDKGVLFPEKLKNILMVIILNMKVIVHFLKDFQ